MTGKVKCCGCGAEQTVYPLTQVYCSACHNGLVADALHATSLRAGVEELKAKLEETTLKKDQYRETLNEIYEEPHMTAWEVHHMVAEEIGREPLFSLDSELGRAISKPINWDFADLAEFIKNNYWHNPEGAIGDIRLFIASHPKQED